MSASILLLPRNLESLAKITSVSAARYSLEAVRVLNNGDGTYRAEATDGRRAVMVAGTAANPDDYPSVPALNAAPNGEMEALFPGKEWSKAFKSVQKKELPHASLNNLALVMGKDVSTWASTNLENVNAGTVRNVEGRWPLIADALPKGSPSLSIKFDAALLAELLQVASRFTDDDNKTVALDFYGSNPVAVIRAKKHDQQFTGVIMSLGAVENVAEAGQEDGAGI